LGAEGTRNEQGEARNQGKEQRLVVHGSYGRFFATGTRGILEFAIYDIRFTSRRARGAIKCGVRNAECGVGQ
jgi:hypothetical protein